MNIESISRPTASLAFKSLDSAIVEVLLLRLDDAMEASTHALQNLERQSNELKNLRLFKRSIDNTYKSEKPSKGTSESNIRKYGVTENYHDRTTLTSHYDGSNRRQGDGTVRIGIGDVADYYQINLRSERVSDIAKISASVDVLISEASSEAQKLSTIANDYYQQLTQLVRELSGLLRTRHESRSNPSTRY